MARRTLLIMYIDTYLLAVGSTIRDARFWSIALLLGGYPLLLFAEPFLVRRNRPLTYIYLFVQTAIICTLSSITPSVDFWAALFCPLVVQVMHAVPQRTGLLMTGSFAVVTSIFLLWGLGLEVGLPLVLVYAVVDFLLAAFIVIILEAVAARRESQKRQVMGREVVVAVTNGRLDFGTWERIFYGEFAATAGSDESGCWSRVLASRCSQLP